MGTLAFLLFKWAKSLDTPYDSYWLCLLMSLDAQTLLRYWVWRWQRG